MPRHSISITQSYPVVQIFQILTRCALRSYSILYVHRGTELAPVTPKFSNVATKVAFLPEYLSFSFRFLFNSVCFQLVVQRGAPDAEQFSSQRTVAARLLQRTDYLFLFHFHVLQGQGCFSRQQRFFKIQFVSRYLN